MLKHSIHGPRKNGNILKKKNCMFYRGKIIHVKTCHDYHSVGGGKLSTDKHETCICDCVPVIEKKINHG